MGYTEMVKEFTAVCNDGLPDRPVVMSAEAIEFVHKMVNDELEELRAATTTLEQADALIDAIYYICDCAVKHGLNLDLLFEIVHSANMAKIVNGRVIKRPDGKVIKPEGWQDPHAALAVEIERQSRAGAFTTP